MYRCCTRLCFFDTTLEKDSVESHVQDKTAHQRNAFFTGLRVLLVIHNQWCDPLTCEVTTEVTYEDFNTNPTSIRVLFLEVCGRRISEMMLAKQDDNRSLKRSILWMCADQNQEHLMN